MPPPSPRFLPPVEAGASHPPHTLTLTRCPHPPPHPHHLQWKPGSTGAHAVFADFLSGRLKVFDRDRAKTDRASTSRLSPHIHHGEISVRYIWHAARAQGKAWRVVGEGGTSLEDFLRQLGYRE